jgi:hypothetical protein
MPAMAGRPHYNHQTWQNGRNVVRYVPAEAEEYADEIIRRTRQEHAKNKKPKRREN